MNYLREAYIRIRFIAIFVAVTVFISGIGLTNPGFPLPTPKIYTKPLHLPVMRGIEFDVNNPLDFKFYFDTMSKRAVADKEIDKTLKYFLGFLTIPQDKLWVNLSPYEKDRIIPDSLSQLDIGKDLLLEDYLLKQLTASLTNPQTFQGKKFWQQVYAVAQRMAQTTKVPINSFYKIWIVPDKAEIYECISEDRISNNQLPITNKLEKLPIPNHKDLKQNKTIAFVKDAKLKVMMETDYYNNVKQQGKGLISPVPDRHNLRTQGTTSVKIQNPAPYKSEFSGVPLDNINKKVREINNQAKEIFKKELLPIIEREVNQSIKFASLRQMYYALILAKYFKDKINNISIYDSYINQEKTQPISLNNPKVKEMVYQSYLNNFKQGVYDISQKVTVRNSNKSDCPGQSQKLPSGSGTVEARRYFSGGMGFSSFGYNAVRFHSVGDLFSKVKVSGNLLAVSGKARFQFSSLGGGHKLFKELVEKFCSSHYHDAIKQLELILSKVKNREDKLWICALLWVIAQKGGFPAVATKYFNLGEELNQKVFYEILPKVNMQKYLSEEELIEKWKVVPWDRFNFTMTENRQIAVSEDPKEENKLRKITFDLNLSGTAFSHAEAGLDQLDALPDDESLGREDLETFELAKNYFILKAYDSAEEEFLKIYEKHKDKAIVYLYLIAFYKETKDSNKEIRMTQEVLAIDSQINLLNLNRLIAIVLQEIRDKRKGSPGGGSFGSFGGSLKGGISLEKFDVNVSGSQPAKSLRQSNLDVSSFMPQFLTTGMLIVVTSKKKTSLKQLALNYI